MTSGGDVVIVSHPYKMMKPLTRLLKSFFSEQAFPAGLLWRCGFVGIPEGNGLFSKVWDILTV